MACCGGHIRRISKEIVKQTPAIAPFGDLVSVTFTGSERDIFYGNVSGNRYVVLPGETLEVDKADLERFVASGLFTVLD